MANDLNLNANEIRAKIHVINIRAQIDSFGNTWEKTARMGGNKNKRALKDTKKLLKKQCKELDEIMEIGSNFKNLNT